jgi:hypothetical protein
MQRRQFFSHVFACGFAASTACCVTGCGTLLHSERRNQPHSNQIDWGIVALDSLGLLLFFIPGIVAFAVDFSTGAIYLPFEQYYPGSGAPLQPYPAGPPPQAPPQHPAVLPPAATSMAPPPDRPTWQEFGLQQVVIPREELQQQRIEQVVTNHVGQQVSLDDSQARLSALPSIERFGEQARRHQSDPTFGFAVESFFARLKQA